MFHPDLMYDIVRRRNEELVAQSRRRRFADRIRRRRTALDEILSPAGPAPSPRHLAVVPPPRPDPDQPGRDPRVA
jgi:hypothetical protein